ncbi:MAG: acyl--CoA ligase [Candidatus Pacebacteria bacterium]|nr:acyl--CoA ligase [Candidatus Paceibacterota bacterium]
MDFRVPPVPRPDEFLSLFRVRGPKNAITQVDCDTNTNDTLTYEELYLAILRGASFFKKQGLKSGDTISYLFENTPEVLILNLICFLFGFRSCPLDVKRDTPEIGAKKLQETKAKLFFYRKNAEKILSLYSPTASYEISDFRKLVEIFGKGEESINEKEVCNPDSINLVLYTSGTTGFPKGAELSYTNLFYGSYQVGEWFDISEDDVFYIVLPLHHINSTIFSLATLLRGGSLVLPTRYTKSHFWDHLATYRVTMSSIVPTINIDLLEEKEAFLRVKDMIRVKRIQIGSAPVSAKHTTAFVREYGIRLIQGYGSTETALRVTGVPTDLPDKLYFKLLEQNSIGVPLVCNEVVFEHATSENEEGELCVRGKNVMRGYLGREDETKKALLGNIFHTGDLGYYRIIDGTKYYFLKGRIKEIMIKGGVNISPLFIEEKLREELPWARDVVVVGFPHYRFGEEIGAIIIPKKNDGIKLLEDFVMRVRRHGLKTLSSYETPQSFVIAADSEIAKTATGKVQHIQVRDAFAQKLIDAYTHIGHSSSYEFHIITPENAELLTQAVPLHNHAFPFAPVSHKTMNDRAKNGFVIGAFDHTKKLVGVLTGFFCHETLVQKGKNWEEITGKGVCNTGSAKGEIAVLVSAASVHAKGETIPEKKSRDLTSKAVGKYIESDSDFVVRFHHLKKAGFETGAKLYRIIKNGNPRDRASLGYVILFEYPELSALEKHEFTSDTIGIGLVEAAIRYAWLLKKKKVIPLSRLGEAWKILGR